MCLLLPCSVCWFYNIIPISLYFLPPFFWLLLLLVYLRPHYPLRKAVEKFPIDFNRTQCAGGVTCDELSCIISLISAAINHDRCSISTVPYLFSL